MSPLGLPVIALSGTPAAVQPAMRFSLKGLFCWYLQGFVVRTLALVPMEYPLLPMAIADAVSQVKVEPQSCICPRESYTCRAYAVTGMSWTSEVLEKSAR